MKIFSRTKKDDAQICKVSHFGYNFAKNSKRSAIYKSQFRSAIKHVEAYEKSRGVTLYSNSFNYETTEDFVFYLKEQNLMLASVRVVMRRIIVLLNRMSADGYTVHRGYKDIPLPLEETNAVFLTSDEIERIWKHEVRGKEQDIARDLFLIGCLTGMRYSDFSVLESKNIVGSNIIRRTKKTNETVIVPMHSIVKQILKKHKGEFPKYNNSRENFNKIIKRICKSAGITENILYERTHGFKIVRKMKKKYEFVSSHTARRSFATNAYLAGIEPARIMMLTGHKTEAAFFAYIRINRSENAKTLAEHPFFQ